MTLPRGTTLGPYEVTGPAGPGPTGEMYKGRDTRLNRPVLVRFYEDTTAGPDARARFEQVTRTVAALKHPHILAVYDAGVYEGRPYVVSEVESGGTLAARVARGALSPSEVGRLGVQLAQALAAAHHAGVVHGAVSPVRMHVTPDSRLKVMDFGAPVPAVAGSADAPFRAPELAGGNPPDARADVYAAGAVLYAMATGSTPHVDADGGIAAPRSVNRCVPAALEAVILKALEPDPGERYATAASLGADLERLVREPGASFVPGTPCVDHRRRRAALLRAGRWALAAAAAALIAVALAVWFSDRRPALSFAPRDWVLLTDFDDQTGDPVFDRSLRTALGVAIEQSRHVNVFPDSRVHDALQRMRRNPDNRLDEATAGEVAQREGLKAVLACGIEKRGAGYALTARLIEPGSQRTVLTHSVEVAGRDRVLRALDELGRRVRRDLGESVGALGPHGTPLPMATTASLDALRLYADATGASQDDAQAVELMRRAVATDPDFALAHAWLGAHEYMAGNPVDGEAHFTKALGLLDRLTLRERLWVQATADDWRGDGQRAVGSFQSFVAQYPDDKAGWSRLGWAYLRGVNQPAAAAKAFEEVIAIDPADLGARVNLATCYRRLGKADDALRVYDRVFALRPEARSDPLVNHEYGFALAASGFPDRARAAFEPMLALGGARRASGLRSLALLEMLDGRYRSATDRLREAADLHRADASHDEELRDRILLVSADTALGRAAEAGTQLEAIAALLGSRRFDADRLAIAGKTLARHGRVQAAAHALELMATVAAEVPQSTPGLDRGPRGLQSLTHWLAGEVALARHDPAGAVQQLEMASRFNDAAGILESLAVAQQANQQFRDALRTYEAIAGRPTLGSEDQEAWILSRYELGQLYEQQGQRRNALVQYEALLRTWSQADHEVRAAADAKQRLVRLRQET